MGDNTSRFPTTTLATVPFEVAGVRFGVAHVPVHTDADGRIAVPGEVSDAIQRRICLELIRRGVVHGESFRAIRRAGEFRATELAALLDVRPETISNWETGKKPVSRLAWATLATLFLEKVQGGPRPLTDALRIAAQGPSQGEVVEISLNAW